MKNAQISAAILKVLTSGRYAKKTNIRAKQSLYFCFAAAHSAAAGEITEAESFAIQELLYSTFETCLILGTFLNSSDRSYNRLERKYGFTSNYCFNRRVKWLKALALKLEKEA